MIRTSAAAAMLAAACFVACASILGIDDPTIRSVDDAGRGDAGDAAIEDGADGGRRCQSAESGIVDEGSRCAEVLAERQETPLHVLVVEGHVYWSIFGGNSAGRVETMPTDGGRLPVSFFAADIRPKGLSYRDGFMYVGTQTQRAEDAGIGRIFRMPLDRGTTEDVSGPTPASIRGFAVDDTRVYWLTSDGRLERKALAGGSIEPVIAAIPDPRAIDVDATGIVYSSSGTNDASGGDITSHPSGGAKPWQTAAARPEGLHIDSDRVYFAAKGAPDGTGGAIVALRRDDGQVVSSAATSERPLFVAVDETHVYFTLEGLSDTGGRIGRIAKATPTMIEVLVSGLRRPHGITLDGQYVYFTTIGDGRVWRVAKN